MKLETKYDIGQEVWFMKENKIRSCGVYGLKVNREYTGSKGYTNTISYCLNSHGIYDEELLFSSKEELLKSL